LKSLTFCSLSIIYILDCPRVDFLLHFGKMYLKINSWIKIGAFFMILESSQTH
jgi:hypothetical protein